MKSRYKAKVVFLKSPIGEVYEISGATIKTKPMSKKMATKTVFNWANEHWPYFKIDIRELK